MSNHITVSGKVGQDPELRYTPGGMAVLTFSIADTYGKDEKKKTTWHNITVFDASRMRDIWKMPSERQ